MGPLNSASARLSVENRWKHVLEQRVQIRGARTVNKDETNPETQKYYCYDFCYHSLLNPGLILQIKTCFDWYNFCILINTALNEFQGSV